jgi:hypothetical protein
LYWESSERVAKSAGVIERVITLPRHISSISVVKWKVEDGDKIQNVIIFMLENAISLCGTYRISVLTSN